MNKPFTLTDSQRQTICERYRAGESTVELAQVYGVTKAAIRSLLITRNIPRRINSPELHRTYSCNHAYFDEPIDEHRAYWIGFLLADGCITDRNSLQINLQRADAPHLAKFRQDLASNHHIKYGKQSSGGYGAGKQYAIISIVSIPLATALARYGVIPRKTGLEATPVLPSDMMRHMYRGFVDGDGSISLYSLRRWLNAELEVVGPFKFLKDFSDWLAKSINANYNQPIKSPNTDIVYRLRHGGLRQVSDIIRLLYGGSSVYLDRKYEVAIKIVEMANKLNSHRRDDGLMVNKAANSRLDIMSLKVPGKRERCRRLIHPSPTSPLC